MVILPKTRLKIFVLLGYRLVVMLFIDMETLIVSHANIDKIMGTEIAFLLTQYAS